MQSKFYVLADGQKFADSTDHVRIDTVQIVPGYGEPFTYEQYAVAVDIDGTETILSNPNTVYDAIAAGEFVRVNAKSSRSLRRSHRYAEVYNRGKAAGRKDILLRLAILLKDTNVEVTDLAARVDDAVVSESAGE